MKIILSPQSTLLTGRKTLVLDLDETLVHSTYSREPNSAFKILVDVGSKMTLYVSKRPHVDGFLKEMGKIFEIVVFTAGVSEYANPLLDKLDVRGVIAGRLFREHCTIVEDFYVKDLSRLGRDIDKTLIIDDFPASYTFNLVMACVALIGATMIMTQDYWR